MSPGAPRVDAGKACHCRSISPLLRCIAAKKPPGAASRERAAPRCLNSTEGVGPPFSRSPLVAAQRSRSPRHN
ncbi:hypothetical protein NDU88_002067 [Pleurodeles waltl]|uniref:Uncharacterized protein n=1 Tax=Pleurodeles waltl TaxID=8319 RepID=A0AAV7W1C4_PLEWA|nr:hypothetical protein NDU88_002067 [Pleurodeles waltl]